MAARSVPKAIDPSDARRCRFRRRGQIRQSNAPVVTGRPERLPCERRPATRRRPRSDAEIAGGEASLRSLTVFARRSAQTLRRFHRSEKARVAAAKAAVALTGY